MSTALSVAERRYVVADILKTNPAATIKDIADTLSLPEATIKGDMYALTNAYREMYQEAWFIYRTNILIELTRLKKVCWDKLHLNPNKMDGSRWAEELLRTIDIENRMFGFYAPKTLNVKRQTVITKSQKDAAIDAVLIGERYEASFGLKKPDNEESFDDISFNTEREGEIDDEAGSG